MSRHLISVTAAVWSVLAPLSAAERDRVLSSALASQCLGGTRVHVRDGQDATLAPCTPARARQLVRRGTAHWVSYAPPVIRLHRAQSPHRGESL